MAKEKGNVTRLVKAIRKGYYKKVREPGAEFTHVGKQCPPWCIEMSEKGEPDTSKLSKDITPVTAAAAYIKTLKTAEQVHAFTEGDERKGITEAVEETLERIYQENE